MTLPFTYSIFLTSFPFSSFLLLLLSHCTYAPSILQAFLTPLLLSLSLLLLGASPLLQRNTLTLFSSLIAPPSSLLSLCVHSLPLPSSALHVSFPYSLLPPSAIFRFWRCESYQRKLYKHIHTRTHTHTHTRTQPCLQLHICSYWHGNQFSWEGSGVVAKHRHHHWIKMLGWADHNFLRSADVFPSVSVRRDGTHTHTHTHTRKLALHVCFASSNFASINLFVLCVFPSHVSISLHSCYVSSSFVCRFLVILFSVPIHSCCLFLPHPLSPFFCYSTQLSIPFPARRCSTSPNHTDAQRGEELVNTIIGRWKGRREIWIRLCVWEREI